MVIYSSTKDFKLDNTVIALGKFDGLHLGHKLLIDKLNYYKQQGYQTVMFTFDFHPMALLTGKKQELIYTKEERYRIVEDFGIDVLIEFPFTNETAHTLPDDFVREILVEDLGVKVIVVGDDFRFGYKRAGDVTFLKENEEKYGYRVDNCAKLKIDGEEVGATLIRDHIRQGNMEYVKKLLGRPYMVTGSVIKGKANGRKVSMPTANLNPPDTKLLPPDGVYATITTVDGEKYYSLTNIGKNPTVGDHNDLRVESFLLNFDGDLYEKEIKVFFHKYIRGEMKFADLNALRTQVAQDELVAKKFFKDNNL